jgi:UPF0716 family protein affecting phage T7 exclusion
MVALTVPLPMLSAVLGIWLLKWDITYFIQTSQAQQAMEKPTLKVVSVKSESKMLLRF